MKDGSDPVDDLVGRRVREERLRRGLSQEQVGALLGVSYQQVQKHESGVTRIGAGRLHRLAQALRVPVASLFEEPREAGRAAGLAEDPQPFDAEGAAPDVADREILELTRAYRAIQDAELRRRLLDVTRAIGAMEYRARDTDAAAP